MPGKTGKENAMNDSGYRVYGQRWLVLAATMLVNLTIQILWISYAPVTAQSAAFYGVSELKIGFFAMSFMIAFIPLSIPVSWLIDRFGCKPIVAIGSVLAGVFGMLRGLAGQNYALALAASIGLAAAQPLLLNSWTKVSAMWFPAKERATAVGLITLANLVGTAIGQVLTPALTQSASIAKVQFWYGIAAAGAALFYVAFAREKPATPPDASAAKERALMLDGLKHALSLPHFRRYLAIIFIGLGIFNGVTTWIEGIVRPRGFDSSQAGTAVAIMLVAGVLGAVVVPAASDRRRKRRPFIAIGIIGAVPGLIGLALAPSFWLLALSCAALGFFLVSVNPTGTQYASEIALPTPEGTSNGLIGLAGQISVILVYVMEPLQRATGSYTLPLLIFAGLLVVALLLALRLEEPESLRIQTDGAAAAEAVPAPAGGATD
jgi:MFS family permease